MASIISAGTTSGTSLNLSADTSGQLELKTGSGPTTAITISSAQLTTIANDATISGLTVGKGGGSQSFNTALGYQSLNSASNGNNGQVGVGYQALYSNTTGSGIAVGYRSLYANTSGSNNTAIGESTLTANTTGGRNVGIGDLALTANTTASNNTAVGYQALYANTTGGDNTSVGRFNLQSNTTGYNNSSVGVSALRYNTTGYVNTAVGTSSLGSNTTGNNNTALGDSALYSNTTASNHTAVGYQASFLGNQGNSTSVGSQALYTGGGGGDVAVGYRAFYAANSSGGAGVAIGYEAGTSITSGYYNTFVGMQAGLNATTGINNIAIGKGSGADAVFSISTESNRAIFGTNATTNAYVKVAWTVTSDARDKTNIKDVPHGLAFVQQLQPKQYQFKVSREDDTPSGNVRYGFLAQDILALEGDNPVIIDNEQPENLKYQGESLVPVLVKAIQELNAKVDAQAAEIAALKGAK